MPVTAARCPCGLMAVWVGWLLPMMAGRGWGAGVGAIAIVAVRSEKATASRSLVVQDRCKGPRAAAFLTTQLLTQGVTKCDCDGRNAAATILPAGTVTVRETIRRSNISKLASPMREVLKAHGADP